MKRKKIVSSVVALSLSINFANVLAYNNTDVSVNDSEIQELMYHDAENEGIELGNFAVPYEGNIEATQEPAIYNNEVHEEVILGDIEFPDDNEITSYSDNFDVEAISTSDLESSWDSIFSERFGDDYLSPYRNNKSGQSISGNTNRLTIDETDLSLSGKNGMNLKIRRKYDNQYYNYVYSKEAGRTNEKIQRVGYGFIDDSTNKEIYILFTSEDDFYIYMKNGITVSYLPTKAHKTRTIDGKEAECYVFEDVYQNKKDSGIHLTYNSSAKRITDNEMTEALGKLESRILLPHDNQLGAGWDLMLPEASLHSYDSSYNQSSSGVKKYLCNYIGAFRDVNGNVFSLKGNEVYTKYTDDTVTFTSSFNSSHNGFLKYTAYHNTQKLNDTDCEYNFVVKDTAGYSYYFYSTGIDGKINQNQRLYITAIQDNYDNVIQYKYDNGYSSMLTKIIDTYGREVNITSENGTTVVSYYDELENTSKTITYSNENIAASELQNDSLLKDKDVLRFKVTNEEGDTTVYDTRSAESANYMTNGTVGLDMHKVPDFGMYSVSEHSLGYNIERIIYPTGAETRYKYDLMYYCDADACVVKGVYNVDESYDINDGKDINHKNYDISGKSNSIILKTTDDARESVIENKYNADGLMIESKINKAGSSYSSPVKTISNLYDSDKNISKQTISMDKISNTTYYEYNLSYPDMLMSQRDDEKQITYTYHTANGGYTKVPKIVTYKYKSGNTYETDYAIERTINDKASVEYERIIQDSKIKSQTKYEYDDSGRNTAVIRWTGKGVKDTLDETAENIRVEMPYIENADKTYSIESNINNIKDADNNDADSIREVYDYNIYGSPIRKTDTAGNSTEVKYDSLSRPIKYSYPSGAEREIQYNTKDKYTIIKEESGRWLKNVYDGFGSLKGKYVLYKRNWKPLLNCEYDNAGRLSECIKYSSSGVYTKEIYTYDLLDRVSVKTVFDNLSKKLYEEDYTYKTDINNTIITKSVIADTENKPADVILYYDKYNRLVKEEATDGEVTASKEYTYDYKGNKLTETDANGNTTSYKYDVLGNMTNSEDAVGYTTMAAYDMLSRAVTTFDTASWAFTYSRYDALGRLQWQKRPFGKKRSITKQYYDTNSNLIKKSQTNGTDENGAVETYTDTLYAYDVMGNLIGKSSGSGNETSAVQYWYDSTNRMIAAASGLDKIDIGRNIPQSGNVTLYEYDSLGYKSKEIDSLGNFTSYNNDYMGNVLSYTDKNGSEITNKYGTYGIENVVIESEYEDEQKVSRYDVLGRVASKTSYKDSDSDNVTYKYDAFGRLIEEDSINGTNTYSYDANSNVTNYTLTIGKSVKNSADYEYDGANELVKEVTNGKTITYKYDSHKMYEKNVDGNVTSIEYNYALLPKSYTTKRGDEILNSYTYTYSTDGNRIGEVDNINGINREYEYDTVGRLKSEAISGNMNRTMSYEYDYRGNREKEYVSGDENYIIQNVYDDNNKIIGSTKYNNGSVIENEAYYYDNNGNQTEKRKLIYAANDENTEELAVTDSTDELFMYDLQNRLIQYTNGDTNASYTYGANGLRKSKKVGNKLREYVWSGQNLSAEYSGSGLVNTYSYGVDGIVMASFNGNIDTYLKDAHGNITGTLDVYGNLEFDYMYEAFGNLLNKAYESDPNPFRYCGEYYDTESNLLYLRNRYYDSKTGRFITEDPIKDGINWYGYCGSNPIILLDPSGLKMQAKKEDADTVLNQIQPMTDDDIGYEEVFDENGESTGYVNFVINHSYDTNRPVGQKLISDLINDDQIVNVNIGKTIGKDATNVTWKAKDDPDGKIQIYVDPEDTLGKGKLHVKVYDSDKSIYYEEAPAYIISGHEFVHAWRQIKGLFDTDAGEKGQIIGQAIEELPPIVEEIATMGADYLNLKTKEERHYVTQRGIISENGLRIENGLNVRYSLGGEYRQ